MKYKYLLVCSFLLSVGLQVQAQDAVQKDSVKNYFEIQDVKIHGKGKHAGPLRTIDAVQMQQLNIFNVTDALNLLPGVSISQMGARNEGSFLVRGFNSLRTPVFYDGVPIYTPYDGNFDLNRFTTFEVEKIAVDKGLVSVQYGPNTMGGAVNIVSRKPVKDLDLNAQVGTGFAEGAGVNSYFSSLNIGTRKKKYYAMAMFSLLKADPYVISRKFESTDLQPGLIRPNSDTKDLRLSAKIGYTPKETDEYSLTVIRKVYMLKQKH